MQTGYPIIPETITIHLGNPNDDGKNITIPFNDYIKNVASSELYPTWPENALRANIYAQISFALNRIYTEHYRSQGYNFDITNKATYDQNFMDDRVIFDSIGTIVDDIFDSYIVQKGSPTPFLAQHCNGITSVCNGLSQWGTLALAQNGYSPHDILRYYYGDEISIETDVPVGSIKESYPGTPQKMGSQGYSVKTIKNELELVRKNYPAIPGIKSENDIFDVDTLNAVIAFQKIFNLVPDGIVDKGTWYKLQSIYDSTKNLEDLIADIQLYEKSRAHYTDPLKLGDQGDSVKTVQHLLSTLAYFDPDISVLTVDGVFGPKTEAAMMAFQRKYGFTPDGTVTQSTWRALNENYANIINNLPFETFAGKAMPYPGYVLSLGLRNRDVETLQMYLSAIAAYYPWARDVEVSGYFDNQTYEAIQVMQKQTDIKETGVVGDATWLAISNLYNKIITEEKV